MDTYTVRRLAQVLAVQAEIEGMKADNALRALNNESPAHGSSAFDDMASALRNLAYSHDDQL